MSYVRRLKAKTEHCGDSVVENIKLSFLINHPIISPVPVEEENTHTFTVCIGFNRKCEKLMFNHSGLYQAMIWQNPALPHGLMKYQYRTSLPTTKKYSAIRPVNLHNQIYTFMPHTYYTICISLLRWASNYEISWILQWYNILYKLHGYFNTLARGSSGLKSSVIRLQWSLDFAVINLLLIPFSVNTCNKGIIKQSAFKPQSNHSRTHCNKHHNTFFSKTMSWIVLMIFCYAQYNIWPSNV